MAKIITDEKLIDEVLSRGVKEIFPNRDVLKKKLMSGEKIRMYCGYDPTASALHIGNAISINKLGQFQKLGHEIIFLIGDFTGMIGDPTDKTTTRKKMTRLEVLENCKNYKEQASKYLRFDGENPAIIKYNSKWNDRLSFRDLIELSSNFTLQQMINRKMFKRNLAIVKCEHCNFEWLSPIQFGMVENVTLIGNKTNCPKCGKMTGMNKENISIKEVDQIRETPIGFHELLYPFAQAYDSLAMQVDLEIGGNDQAFNMLCGRDMMKLKNASELFNLSKTWGHKLMFWNKEIIKPKEKFVMTLKLLEDETGKKMGKTEGNVVNLNETAENMFGQIMAWSDGLIDPGFELCTNVEIEEIKKINIRLNPRDAKIKLAHEITKINHGEEAAKKAEENFINTFSKKEIPTDVPTTVVTTAAAIMEIIVKEGLAKSNAEAKRKIEQGGVEIDGKKISDVSAKIVEDMNGKILKVGKREFRKIVIK